MMTFDSLPQEVIALILQSCDSFRQLQSAIVASQLVHSVWKLNERAILWQVGQVEICGFSDALIAVRATQIATDALFKEELPPDPFPVCGLGGDALKPSLHELKQVQKLQYVAKYLERKMRLYDRDRYASMPDSYNRDHHDWARLQWETWSEECHRAIYRNIAAGAILYRAYHAPIVSDTRPKGFLATLLKNVEDWADYIRPDDDWFSDSDKRYLCTIPLYSIQDYHKVEEIFQPLERLFVEESRKKAPYDPPKRLASRSSETDKSLFQSFKRYAGIQNPQSLDPDHAETLFHQILHFIYMLELEPELFLRRRTTDELEEVLGPRPSIFAIFFGYFVPLKLFVDDRMVDASRVLALPGLESKTLHDSNYFGFQYMDTFLHKASQVGGIPNCYGADNIAPPPHFYFAEYLLRKYFSLRFAAEMDDSADQSPWDAFTRYGAVFTNFASDSFAYGEDLFECTDKPTPAIFYKNADE